MHLLKGDGTLPRWVCVFDLQGLRLQHVQYPVVLSCLKEINAMDARLPLSCEVCSRFGSRCAFECDDFWTSTAGVCGAMGANMRKEYCAQDPGLVKTAPISLLNLSI